MREVEEEDSLSFHVPVLETWFIEYFLSVGENPVRAYSFSSFFTQVALLQSANRLNDHSAKTIHPPSQKKATKQSAISCCLDLLCDDVYHAWSL